MFYYSHQVTALAVGLLAGAITVFLVLLKKKTPATWWLASANLGLALYTPNIFGVGVWLGDLLAALVYGVGTSLVAVSFLQFAYTFLEDPYPRERRTMLWMTGLLLVVSIILIFQLVLGNAGFGFWLIYGHLSLLGFCLLMSMVVLVRKIIRAKRSQSSSARRRIQGYQGFLWVGLIGLSASVIPIFLESMGVYGAFRQEINNLLLLLVVSLFVLLFINYSAHSVTLQVKLVGISFATVLALMGTIPVVVYQGGTLIGDYARSEVRAPFSLSFTPTSDSSYHAKPGPTQFIPPKGDTLALSVQGPATTVRLPFPFPFYDQTYQSLRVIMDGSLAFDTAATPSPYALLQNFYSPLPKISPFHAVFNPQDEGQMRYAADSSQAVITWDHMAHPDRPDIPYTFQAVLHADGRIDFNYRNYSGSLKGHDP